MYFRDKRAHNQQNGAAVAGTSLSRSFLRMLRTNACNAESLFGHLGLLECARLSFRWRLQDYLHGWVESGEMKVRTNSANGQSLLTVCLRRRPMRSKVLNLAISKLAYK
jgi:hypothetical protein